MDSVTPAVRHLVSLPRSEREAALESIVVQEFKNVLLMTDDEDLPPDESFFDLGLTSLRLTEAKEQLESRLGGAISATHLFNNPTVERLLDYLMSDVLAPVFAEAESRRSAGVDPVVAVWPRRSEG